jgi:hypothetical protein
MTPTKHCTGCDRMLPLDDEHFYRQGGDEPGFKSRCRECVKAARRAHHAAALARRASEPPPLKRCAGPCGRAEHAAERVKRAAREAVIRDEADPILLCPGCGRTLPGDEFPCRGEYCRPCAKAVALETARWEAAEREKAERRPDPIAPPYSPPDIFLREPLFDPYEIFLAMASEAEDLTTLGTALRKVGIVPQGV